MKEKTTYSVAYKVRNTDPAIALAEVSRNVDSQVRDGKIKQAVSFMQALGFCIEQVWLFLAGNSQYKSCEIEIGGVILPKGIASILRNPSRASFEASFPRVREYVAGEIAVSDHAQGVRFLRETDKAGVYKGTKDASIDAQQIAMQVMERRKMVQFVTNLVKQDAKTSVWPEELLKKQQAITAAKKEERKRLLSAKK